MLGKIVCFAPGLQGRYVKLFNSRKFAGVVKTIVSSKCLICNDVPLVIKENMEHISRNHLTDQADSRMILGREGAVFT